MASRKALGLKYRGLVDKRSREKHKNDDPEEMTLMYMIKKQRSHLDKLEKRIGNDKMHVGKIGWYSEWELDVLFNRPRLDDRPKIRKKEKESC